MTELSENFNKETKEFECYIPCLKFIAFTGYGKTEEEAKVDFFNKTAITNPHANINYRGT